MPPKSKLILEKAYCAPGDKRSPPITVHAQGQRMHLNITVKDVFCKHDKSTRYFGPVFSPIFITSLKTNYIFEILEDTLGFNILFNYSKVNFLNCFQNCRDLHVDNRHTDR
jgi:hypothetical protein